MKVWVDKEMKIYLRKAGLIRRWEFTYVRLDSKGDGNLFT